MQIAVTKREKVSGVLVMKREEEVFGLWWASEEDIQNDVEAKRSEVGSFSVLVHICDVPLICPCPIVQVKERKAQFQKRLADIREEKRMEVARKTLERRDSKCEDGSAKGEPFCSEYSLVR